MKKPQTRLSKSITLTILIILCLIIISLLLSACERYSRSINAVNNIPVEDDSYILADDWYGIKYKQEEYAYQAMAKKAIQEKYIKKALLGYQRREYYGQRVAFLQTKSYAIYRTFIVKKKYSYKKNTTEIIDQRYFLCEFDILNPSCAAYPLENVESIDRLVCEEINGELFLLSTRMTEDCYTYDFENNNLIPRAKPTHLEEQTLYNVTINPEEVIVKKGENENIINKEEIQDLEIFKILKEIGEKEDHQRIGTPELTKSVQMENELFFIFTKKQGFFSSYLPFRPLIFRYNFDDNSFTYIGCKSMATKVLILKKQP